MTGRQRACSGPPSSRESWELSNSRSFSGRWEVCRRPTCSRWSARWRRPWASLSEHPRRRRGDERLTSSSIWEDQQMPRQPEPENDSSDQPQQGTAHAEEACRVVEAGIVIRIPPVGISDSRADGAEKPYCNPHSAAEEHAYEPEPEQCAARDPKHGTD